MEAGTAREDNILPYSNRVFIQPAKFQVLNVTCPYEIVEGCFCSTGLTRVDTWSAGS